MAATRPESAPVMDVTQTPSPLFGPLVSPRFIDDETDDELLPDPSPRMAADRSESEAPLLPVLSAPTRTYLCPGEKHPIPRSVHLARLAAFYPNCRLCEHRADTGHLPRSMIGRLEQTAQRGEQVSPFQRDGIRGAYLNQLTRKLAGRIAAAFAEHLWSIRPLQGRPQATEDNDDVPVTTRRLTGPTVVIGQDARPSSPDLSVGISESLRRMGCDVVDVGRVSRPCFAFAVDHLQAQGGLFITGSGSAESWTGIDVVGPGGIPWSIPGTLSDIERRYHREISRPTRQGGAQRYFDATVPYRASLLKHYQTVRPQKLACFCEDATIVETLKSLLEPHPAEVHWLDDAKLSPGGRLLALKTISVDLGVLLNEEGTAIRLFDRDGRPVSEQLLLGRVLKAAVSSKDPFVPEQHDQESESIALRMQDQTSTIGVQSGGRLWFRDAFPRCDALITIGHLLQSHPSDA
ncbi:MAG: hypothetical protein KDA86_16350 [Planctomycetaceae bacterium]|nr:hypothetical protein [Planctomycetaceae bacterium]